MHASHTQTGKCEYGTEYTAWHSYTKFNNNFWCWTPERENDKKVVKFSQFPHKRELISHWTYDEDTPRSSRYTEALSLKLLYACSNPISSVFSSTISTIIATNKYTKPVTMHVERSPIDSSLLKYCMVNEISNLLEKIEIRKYWVNEFEGTTYAMRLHTGYACALTMQKIWLKDTTSCWG